MELNHVNIVHELHGEQHGHCAYRFMLVRVRVTMHTVAYLVSSFTISVHGE